MGLLGTAGAVWIGATLIGGGEERLPAGVQEPGPSPRTTAEPDLPAVPVESMARTAAPHPTERLTAAASGRPAQGLTGLLLDGGSRPVGGVAVHLVESPANEPLALPRLRDPRHYFAPVAATESTAAGTFAIGLPVVQDKTYDLFVCSPWHALARLPGLRLLPDVWHDLGAIVLEPGQTLRGRVTVAGRPDIPVPLATVTVEAGAVFADTGIAALPDLPGGLVAEVDPAGYYELRHAPSRGTVRVSAVGPGFARVTRFDVAMGGGGPVYLNFELPPGCSIRGAVSNRHGQPIAGARVEATPAGAHAGPLRTFTDDAGRFELHGLTAVAHRLRVQAQGYEIHQELDVRPPLHDLAIALAARHRIQVRVRAPTGEVVRSFRLALRRWLPAPEGSGRAGSLGLVTDIGEQRVRLDGMTDTAVLDGVPSGRFVCEVEAEGHARSWSEPFECAGAGDDEGVPRIVVDVVLHRGTTLRGRVVDERDAPLAGAAIATQPDGQVSDHPLVRLLGGAVPERISAHKVAARADGSFALERLAAGDYQLVVDHPEACRRIVTGLRFDGDGELTLPPIRLERGAVVTGRATVGGRLAGQLKVVLATTPAATPAASLRVETITDADGRFRMPRRVPPGDYELRAAIVGTADADADPVRQLLQLQRSTTIVHVAPGQHVVECDLDLPHTN